jgi:hypothetical protein
MRILSGYGAEELAGARGKHLEQRVVARASSSPSPYASRRSSNPDKSRSQRYR